MISSISTPLPLRSPLQFSVASSNPMSVNFPQRRRSTSVTAAYATATSSAPKMSCSFSSFYHTLGISSGASGQEIKSAYRRLARTLHPDVAAIEQKNSSTNDFMKIHEAYSTLYDPEKRADYDRRLFQQQIRPLVMAESVFSRYGGSGYVSRNWESDQCW